jgi:predicted AlkP superfamily pyrophosphatase or phosphodiesterase
MRQVLARRLACCAGAVAVIAALALPASAANRTVVVLLFDGWAPALLDGVATPVLDRMRREGAWTHRFVPPFPSISLISGVTISTGCWPEHHGIVTNVFLDPVRGRYDHDRDADWLTGCEHLQQAAERQGVRAAAIDWYGARSATKGDQATYATARTWQAMPDDRAKADEVVRLLQLPDAERPRLIAAYFKGPDGAAHFQGMDAEATRAAVAASDAAVGVILDALAAAPFASALFVTTDHGMRPVRDIVNIRRILYNHGIDAEPVSTGTTSFLYFRDPGTVDAAYEVLSRYDQFEVIRTSAPPPYMHLGRGPRVPPLIVSARPPYFIEDPKLWPWWVRWLGDYGPEFMWAQMSLKASHGYPPDEDGMPGLLYAWGSGVAKGHEVARVEAIDLHPTVMHLLGISPGAPVDGKIARDILTDS